MRLITIDASTKSVAFGIFIDGRLEKYGKINIQGKDIYEKCANTAHTLTSFARLYQIEKAIIEKPVYVNSPQVMMMLSIAQGALIGALAVGGVRKFEGVVPTAWASKIGVTSFTKAEKAMYGDAKRSPAWNKANLRDKRKQLVMDKVNDYFNINVTDNDIGDALGIGMAYLLTTEGR